MPKLNFSQLQQRSPHDGGEAQQAGEAGRSNSREKQSNLSRFFSPASKPSQSHTCSPSASTSGEAVSSQSRKRTLASTSRDEETNKRVRVQRESRIHHKLSSFRSPGETDTNSTQDVQDISSEISPQRGATGPDVCQDSLGDLKRPASRVRGSGISTRGRTKQQSLGGADSDGEEVLDVPSTSSTSTPSLNTEDGLEALKGKFQFNSVQKLGKPHPDNVKSSSPSCIGPLKGVKYTPLELQFIDIKKQYPDALLFVECGYKYKFFAQDAEIAAKELNIFCHPDHNFMVASVPVHRLFVHTRRLVAKGYKVGVVKQTETAALKAAGDTRSAPFQRKLMALYTKSTLIGEDVDPVSGSQTTDMTDGEMSAVPSNYLLCLSEFTKPRAKESRNLNVEFGLVAIQPATGDVIYDSFHDNDHLSELDTRIHHIQPVELLLPEALTLRTEKLVQDIVSSSTTDDDRIRIERMDNDHFEYSEALEVVSSFYGGGSGASSEAKETQCKDSTNQKLQEILSLPVPVICCLAALLRYLKEFQLHRVLKMTSNFVSFSATRRVMRLDSCALRNLEIFKNQTDGLSRGSLFWVLDHTKTRFGSRLLRKWLAEPLMDTSDINSRQDAVEEILHSNCEALTQLKELLGRAPDLEKGICSIYHKKCSTAEFYSVVKSLSKLSQTLGSLRHLAEEQLTSELLKTIFSETPSLLDDIQGFLDAVNEKAAKEGKKSELFRDTSSFPGVTQCEHDISDVLAKIQEHRREVRLILKKPSLEYIMVSGLEFLIEVKNSRLKEIPQNWTKISSTKQVSRFHTPFLVKAYKTLSQLRERLAIECQNAWLLFLDSFGNSYFAYRKAVQHLAAFDCLSSLAELAQQEGYCRPEFNQDGAPCIHIENGKHPVISLLLGEQEQYVPNSTQLYGTGRRCMIITGPNMGGKSSYIRQVALITIMAQVGSWVPAESASLGVADAVYTRMGASDNIYQRRSTFMVELQEASDILSQATDRSLVILDELGRGTSTHDGVAIAHATARHFIQEVKCLMLFVTHYPPLAELERQFPDYVTNHHMGFLLHEDKKGENDDADIITFLYQLVPGMAARSYGLNVARLAEIPAEIIKMASTKSHQLEDAVMATRRKRSSFKELWRCLPASVREKVDSIKSK